MTTRKIGSTTYTQSFDVENRLIQVTASGSSQVSQFAYDASGQRFRTFVETPGVSRTITTYPFAQYEVELRQSWEPCSGPCGGGDGGNWVTMATIIRRTYMLGGQAIATRITGDPTNNGLFYLHGDHLGSTSLLTYGSSPGHIVPGTETRYLPYGTHRLAPTTQLTERDYTGQKENLELGLLYYNARFYLPGIGRFASADTIVPDPVNPQQLNRYAYVLGNPLSYFDPTGHSCDSPESGDEYRACQAQQDRQQQEKEILASTVQIIATAHVFMDGMWIPIVSRSHATLKDGQYLVTHNHFSFMELIDQGFKVVIDNVTLRTTEGKQLHGNWNDFTVHNFEEAPGTLLLDFGSQRLGRIAGRFGIQSANFDNTMPVMGDEVAQINWDGQVSYVQWGKVIGGPKRSGTWIIELNSLTRGGASGGGVFFGRNHIGNNFYTGSTHSGAALNPLAVTR